MALEDHKNSAPSLTACVKEKENRIYEISQKLERLLTGYLDQVIDQVDYTSQKAKLLSEKKSLQEEISDFSHKQNDWLAPFQNWLKDAQSLDKIASDSDLFTKKVWAKEIFGSHLVLANREARLRAPSGEDSSGQNAWAALRAAHDLALKKPKSFVMVSLLYQARTYFQNR